MKLFDREESIYSNIRAYWNGDKPFLRALLLWGVIFFIPVICAQILMITGIWFSDWPFRKTLSRYLHHNATFILDVSFWLIILAPVLYQPFVIKILCKCRHNIHSGAFGILCGYIFYYIISLLLMFISIIGYFLSNM